MKTSALVTLVAITVLAFSGALAGDERGIWIEDTPCSEGEILEPVDYRGGEDGGADARYVCTNAEDYAISLIRNVEGSHDSVTCYVVAKRPRHWYRQHGLKVVATEMCHH